MLLRLQALGQLIDQLRGHGEARRWRDRPGSGRQRFDRGLATHAATRRRVEVAFQSLHVDIDVRDEIDAQGVGGAFALPAVMDFAHLGVRLQDAFREQEAGSEFEIVARSAHRDRNWLMTDLAVLHPAEADFQWLLNGDGVVSLRRRPPRLEALYRHPAGFGLA